MPFEAAWVGLEMIILSKVSHTKTKIWYCLYVQSKKMKQMNLFTKQKYTHRLWRQAYGYQGGNVWEEG